MDKDTIERYNKQLTEEAKKSYQKAEQVLKDLLVMGSDDTDLVHYVKELQQALENGDYDTYSRVKEHLEFWDDYLENITVDWKSPNEYFSCLQRTKHNENCFDSEIVHMEGDVVITDPCYVIKKTLSNPPRYPECKTYNITYEDYVAYKNKELTNPEKLQQAKEYSNAIWEWEQLLKAGDWSLSERGRNAKEIGLSTSIARNNLYGDWSCTVYNTDTNEELGEFCADTGMVGVFLLDEILQYNPEFDYHLNRPWTTAVIRGFKGDVQIKVKRTTGVYEADSNYHKKGEAWSDDEVYVVGIGNINFITEQTGL